MSKTPYKPERQRIEGNIIFCHGKGSLGHTDVIMKSIRELTDEQLEENTAYTFVHGLIFLRKAEAKEIRQYCKRT